MSERPQQNVLRKLYTETFQELAQAKQDYLHVDGLESILEEYPEALDGVKHLCRQIRRSLFRSARAEDMILQRIRMHM